jgi:hypothetical protein
MKPSDNHKTESRWRVLAHGIDARLRNALALACAGALLAGCASMGPATVSRDRFNYAAAISESWKQQMLLNLLKIRYSDAPVFLDVANVINSYTLSGEANLYGEAAEPGRGDQFLGAGVSGRYEDRPTITYSPLTGSRFARSLLSPLPVSSVLYLIQAGYPVDIVLRVTVSSINGMENAYGGLGNSRPGDPRFFELLKKMRASQDAGGMGMRVKQVGQDQAVVIFLRPISDETRAGDLQDMVRLLGLKPDARELNVVYGSFQANDAEVAFLTRSMLQILTDFASDIDVPARDAEEGRVYVKPRASEEQAATKPLIRIRQSAELPANAYAASRYRDQWFWIDDRDVVSKSMFSFLMFMFALTETSDSQAGAPVVTVPAR